MWVVADLDDDYIAKMEDVLETYERPYDPQQPVVCFGRKADHPARRCASHLSGQPGREARRDNEYERCGTANVFCAVEPKAGRHFTFATPDRSALNSPRWPPNMALAYPQAKTIHLVHGQSQHPSPEVAGGCFRSRDGRRSLGPLHRSLHPYARKLAQSSGDRNRDLLAAMSGETANPRPEDPATGGEGLESANEP